MPCYPALNCHGLGWQRYAHTAHAQEECRRIHKALENKTLRPSVMMCPLQDRIAALALLRCIKHGAVDISGVEA